MNKIIISFFYSNSERVLISCPITTLGPSPSVCLFLNRITTKMTTTRNKSTDVTLRPITADDTSEPKKRVK